MNLISLKNLEKPLLNYGLTMSDILVILMGGLGLMFVFNLFSLPLWLLLITFLVFLIIFWQIKLYFSRFRGFKNFQVYQEMKKKLGFGKGENSTQLLPIESFQHSCAYMKNGTKSIGFEIFTPEEFSLSLQEIQAYMKNLSTCIKGLPPSTTVQFFTTYHKVFPSQEEYNEDFFIRSRQKHHASRKKIKKHTYVFLNGKALDLEKIEKSFVSTLPKELTTKKLSEERLLQVLLNSFNCNENNKEEGFEKEIGFARIKRLDDGVLVGDRYAKILTMTSQVEDPFTHSLYRGMIPTDFFHCLFNGFAAPHNVSFSFQLEDKNILKKRINQSNFFLGVNALKTEEALLQKNEALGLLKTLREDKLIYVSGKVVVFGASKDQVTNNANALSASARRLGADLKIENTLALPSFFSSQPLCSGVCEDWLPITLTTAVSYNTFSALPEGDAIGVTLQDIHKNSVKWDFTSSNLKNPHKLVIGSTGSGKSFFNAKMIKEKHEAGYLQIIIDVGGTYRRLFKHLKGKYFELREDEALGLNPFFLATQKNHLPLEKREMLISFLGKIWKGDLVKNPLSPAEKSTLGEFLENFYASKNLKKSLRDFYRFIETSKEAPEKEIFWKEEFLTALKPFALGIFAKHFNAESGIDLGKDRLICFELEKIKANSTLYPLVAQVLFDTCLELYNRKKAEKKFIEIEEAWSMLEDYGVDYIESFFRKGRKNNVAIKLITQDVVEIENSLVGEAVKANAGTFILLECGNEKIRKKISDFAGLNTLDREKFAVLTSRKGELAYRQALIKEEQNSRIFNINVSLEEYALFTSDPKEVAEIDSFIEKMKSLTAGVQSWVKQKKTEL